MNNDHRNADAANEGKAFAWLARIRRKCDLATQASARQPGVIGGCGLDKAIALASDHADHALSSQHQDNFVRASGRARTQQAARPSCLRMSPMANAANPGTANNMNNDHRIRIILRASPPQLVQRDHRNVLGPKAKAPRTLIKDGPRHGHRLTDAVEPCCRA